MGKQLRRVGLAIRDVRRDGNCLFRAVSDQVYGTEEHHAHVRKWTCDFMEQNEERFLPWFGDEDQSYGEYVEHMRTDGVWAGHIEIQAISLVFEVNIRIHQCSKPSYTIHNHAEDDAPAIHMFYHFGEHYASVRPLRQLNDRSPAGHPPLPQPSDSSGSEEEAAGAGTGGGRASRSRRRRRPPEDIPELWKSIDRKMWDVSTVIDHAEAAARYCRRVDPDGDAEGGALASEIVSVVAEASKTLVDIQERMTSWRYAHTARVSRRVRDGLPPDSEAGLISDSDSESSSDSFSEGWLSDASLRDYSVVVRREKAYVLGTLEYTCNEVAVVLKAARELRAKNNPAAAKAGAGRNGKQRHPSKRREQEERRRQRKSRRRLEQEEEARRKSGRKISASAFSIGMWGPHIA